LQSISDGCKSFKFFVSYSNLEIPVEESKLRNNVSSIYQESLVSSLLCKSGGDLELALLFGGEYKISQDFVYKSFTLVEIFLVKDQPCNSTRFSRLSNITSLITNKNLFAETLKDWYHKVSPYDYEALSFISQSIVSISADSTIFKNDILIIEII
jgi:hypothetical protein